ncbi:MAG: hypothetical protein ACKN9E_08665 [Microcystaceae cyanobacterium]
MTDRLDRIESLVEGNAKSIEALNVSLMELKSRTDSNAKSIEALCHQLAEDRAERKERERRYEKDRAHVFEWMARLAAAQADFYEVQSYYLTQFEKIDDKLTTILDRLTPPEESTP